MSATAALLRRLRPALEEVLTGPTSARPLPTAVFTSPEALAIDARALFDGRWIAAAHGADVEAPGAWSRVGHPGRSDLVVARDASLGLSLLSSLCRHRGVPLLEGDAGAVPTLSLACRYHGWSYALDGALCTAPGLPASARKDALGLRAGAVRDRGPLVWAREGAGAGDPAPPLPPWLERARLAPLRRVHVAAHVVRANWKLCVGNFQEAHHFPRVHPGLEARTPFARSASVVPPDGGWLGGTMQLREGLETVSGTGRRDGRPFIAAEEDQALVHDAWIAPNLLLSLQPDYLLSYRLAPLAHDATRIDFSIDVHAGAPDAEIAAGVEDLVRFWTTTNAEDRAICEAQQRGLASAPEGHRAGPYAESEDGLWAFEAAVARAWLSQGEGGGA